MRRTDRDDIAFLASTVRQWTIPDSYAQDLDYSRDTNRHLFPLTRKTCSERELGASDAGTKGSYGGWHRHADTQR